MTEDKKSDKGTVSSVQEIFKGIFRLLILAFVVLIFTVVAAEFGYEVPVLYNLVQEYVSGEYTEAETEVAASTNVFSVKLDDVCTEYSLNEVAADSKFKGRVLIVSGTIIDIAESSMGNLFIEIAGASGRSCTANCHFSEAHKDKVLTLQKGQHITIKGKCDGVGSTVVLMGCVFS